MEVETIKVEEGGAPTSEATERTSGEGSGTGGDLPPPLTLETETEESGEKAPSPTPGAPTERGGCSPHPQSSETGAEESGQHAPFPVCVPAEVWEQWGHAPPAGSKKRTWRRKIRRKLSKLRAGDKDGPQSFTRGEGIKSKDGTPAQPTLSTDRAEAKRKAPSTFPNPNPPEDIPIMTSPTPAPLDGNVQTWADVASKGRGRGRGLAAHLNLAEVAAPSKKRRRCQGPRRDGEANAEAPVVSLPGYDSHFHPDRIGKKCGESTNPGRVPDHPVELVGGVANYCDPEFYLDPNFIDRVVGAQEGHNSWKIAIGIHPKRATTYSTEHWRALVHHSHHPRVVGFSEVGFDFTVPPQQWRDQENLFKELLDLGTRGRVLILHLRGVTSASPAAHNISRRLLEQNCSSDQRIHLHCFSGETSQVRSWTSRFPHCYFGLSALVKSFSTKQREAVREIPTDRLLLETDAPHLTPHPGMVFNTPRFLGDVGRLVADVRGIPLAELMAITTANARRLYGA